MAITRVGTAQVGASNNGGDVTLTFDVTPSTGDIVYVWGTQQDSGTDQPQPLTAGYTQVASQYTAFANVAVYRKEMGASPDTTVTWDGLGGGQYAIVAGCVVLRGVDTTTPEDATPPTPATGTSGPVDPPAITTVTAGAWTLVVGGSSGSHTPTAPTSYTNFVTSTIADTRRVTGAAATREIASASTEDPAAFGGDWATTGALEWTALTVAIRPASSGTTYTVSVSGSITPTGADVHRSSTQHTGTVTPSGSDVHETSKQTAGAVTPAGSLTLLVVRTVAGATTPTGTVANVETGGTATLDISGASAPSGSLTRQTQTGHDGAATPSGSVALQVVKGFAGTTTPAGSSEHVRAAVVTVSGTVAPSGSLTLVVAKQTSGTVTPAGSLSRHTSHTLTGALTPAGLLARLPAVGFDGAVTPSGVSSHADLGSVGVPVDGPTTVGLSGADPRVTLSGADPDVTVAGADPYVTI